MQQLIVNFKPGYIPPKRKTIAKHLKKKSVKYEDIKFK